MRFRALKEKLDELYLRCDFAGRQAFDPVDLVHRYSRPEDIELVGLVVSALSYGKVALFKAVAERLLAHMGASPSDFIASFREDPGRTFPDISYRFARRADIQALLLAISTAYGEYGSMQSLFTAGISGNDATIRNGIIHAVRVMRNVDLSPVYGHGMKGAGFLHLISGPEMGGAAKRMALYFRWMVRDRDLDFGIWNAVGKYRLVIPLDTHIARIAYCLGLTRRRSSSWATAVDITNNLRQMEPEDPLKYDFVLCHYGISGRCPGKKNPEMCSVCEFHDRPAGRAGPSRRGLHNT